MDDYYLDEEFGVCSSMECTGLMPTPPQNQGEWEAYQALYSMETNIKDIPEDIGKDLEDPEQKK